MSEKLFHVGRPNLGDRNLLMQKLADVLDRNWLTNDGPLLIELESSLAQLLGVKHCICMSSGTLSLELVIRGMGLKGEVILPSFTFIATAHALQWHGIRPVFCDIDPVTLCIDPERAESLITDKTTAIIGVHIYGRACNTNALERIANKHNLRLVYDAAHAVGCTQHGRAIGGFGHCEVFSFHATKVFNTIEGGAITTNESELADRLRRTRNFGYPGDGSESTVELGTNAKMNEFCAAMGLTNLASLDDFIKINKDNYETYKLALAGIPGIDLYTFDHNELNNYQYVIALVD
jgi:dTDP-4-amino-4,6-dideoxygalactose transaminase